jgi:hypothetical protein
MPHQEVMACESRESEEQQQSHALEAAKLQMEAEAARFNAEDPHRSAAARRAVPCGGIASSAPHGATEAIANDARSDEAGMLEQGGGVMSVLPGPLPG